MVEKRRASTRNLREPAPKRRNTLVTASSRSTPTRESPAIRPVEQAETRLPSRIYDNQPLPTISVGAALKATSTLQSIAESGVLTASLLRSRNAWLNEGLFEKFYTKPVKKKKGEHESLNNPPTRCMTKVGTCQIIIEPHMLEATLYTIREWKTDMAAPPLPASKPVTPAAPTPGIPPSSLNSFNVNPSATSPSRTPTPSTGTGIAAISAGVTTTPAALTPASTLLPKASTTGLGAPATAQTPAGFGSATPAGYQPAQPLQPSHAPLQSQTPQPLRPVQNAQQPNITMPRSAPAPAAPTQDPVIQMLAQRASIDPTLKALMKVVASGSANQDQLREFQRHIDELNTIVARQRLNMYNNFNAGAQSPYPASAGTPGQVRAPPLGGTPIFQRAPSAFGTPSTSIQRPIKAPPAPPQPVIGLAMEFTGSNGDRYLFPKYSILEFAPEAKCIIASFLVVRGLNSTSSSSTITTSTTSKPHTATNKKPSSSSTTSTPVKTEHPISTPVPITVNQGPLYHQPVTMRITADNAKVFEQISRTVSSLDEARKHMEDIMTQTKRAEDVVLALRLPLADGEEAVPGMSGAGMLGDANLRRGSIALGTKALVAGVASPGAGEQGKKKKAKVEEVCGYCFTSMGTTGHGIENAGMIAGEVVCQSCAVLLRKSGERSAIKSTGLKITRKVEGPKVLVLGY